MTLVELITMRVRLWRARMLANRARWHGEQCAAHGCEEDRLHREAVEILNVIIDDKGRWQTRATY